MPDQGRIHAECYPCGTMGMNIKDPQVHAMARELAARRGTSVTNAVRQALRAELDRSPGTPEQEEAARRAAGRSSAELQADLYDDAGLPA